MSEDEREKAAEIALTSITCGDQSIVKLKRQGRSAALKIDTASLLALAATKVMGKGAQHPGGAIP